MPQLNLDSRKRPSLTQTLPPARPFKLSEKRISKFHKYLKSKKVHKISQSEIRKKLRQFEMELRKVYNPTRTQTSYFTRLILSQGFKKGKQSIERQLLEEFLKGGYTVNIGKTPKPRKILLKSGPFAGKIRSVKENVDLFSEAIVVFVASSNLVSIAYQEETKQLEIEFKNGSVYRYSNIPKSLYRGLENAGSKGKYFWKHIRRAYSRYPFQRLRFNR